MGQSAPTQTLIGRTIGNYEVVEKLGEGGMGAVYLARHPRIGKKVALKVLHAEFSSDPNIVDRFFTEAKSVNDIGHPNIVDITDFGEIEDDDGRQVVYFFMEFLAGEAVADLLAREAPLPAERAFRIAAQIADALAASHRAGVVHRDLKPDNVFLISRGRMTDIVKVLDFGIAKLTGDQPGSRRTRTGIVIGTPYYMSPEQCEGKGNIDHRADVYALGVLLYEMITGRVPFDGEGYGEILVQHLTQVPQPMRTLKPEVNPYVEAVVLKALEKHRDLRYGSMEEFLQALTDPVSYVDARGGVGAMLSGGNNIRLGTRPDGGYQSPTTASGPTVTGASGAPVGAAIPTPAPTFDSQPYQIGGHGAGTATPFPRPIQTQVPTPAPTHTPTPAPVDPMDYAPPRKSKTPLLALAGVIVLGGIGAVVAMSMGGDDGGSEPSASAATTPPPVAPAPDAAPQLVAPPPVEDATVQVSVESEPAGAQVFVGDETEPRGTTPTTFAVDKGEEAITVVVRHEGYEDENKVVVPDRDIAFDVDLAKVPSEPVASKSSKKSKSSSGTSKKKTRKKKKKKVGDDILVPDL